MSYKIPDYDMPVHILLVLKMYMEMVSEKVPNMEFYYKITERAQYSKEHPVKSLLVSKIIFGETKNVYLDSEIFNTIKEMADKSKVQLNSIKE